KEIKEEMRITRKEGSDVLATKSEIYSNEKVVKYNSCNTLGAFHQLLKDSKAISKNERNAALLQLENEIESISHDVESETNIQNSDINEMVRIQIFSILATMNFIKKKKEI
ncbi:MAG: hypothetical protein KAJ30_08550, partial [Candidatus Heimdallarchaeota archaeon]|nr:hypothetical protein [Candidatus Heimdallarchaeota archaeon]